MEEKISHNRKVKICFFSPASYPFFVENSEVAHGGAELQMFLWARYLSENSNFNIKFLVRINKKREIKKNHNVKLINTIQLKQNESFFLKLLNSIKYLFQLIRINPDIIICTNANAIVGISAFYAILFRKKFIYRTSSLIDVNKNYINLNGLSGKLYKYGLVKAAKVITQNKEHKILLKKNHKIEAPLLKNMIEIKEESTYKKQFILWVSRFAEMKNPELFLQLSGFFPERKFVMICPHTDSNKPEWEKLKSKAEKLKNLTFIRKVPFSEIQEYFNKAELFLNTSDYEGFPNTFLQAAQSKTPIVSLNVNPDNFITDYNCGIFANGNFDLLYSKMKELLKNKSEIIQKGKNCFKYLQENHDINIAGEKLKFEIENVLW
ncbi:MAG: glycosyltransferase family 4 protein [Bacteroidales bacterium]|nr:glycosyltransferase family 4 protein [Bacteroidales bacterium]